MQRAQHEQAVRRELTQDNGGNLQEKLHFVMVIVKNKQCVFCIRPGDSHQRPNESRWRTDDSNEARPYKRQMQLDYLTAPATLDEPATRAISIGIVFLFLYLIPNVSLK